VEPADKSGARAARWLVRLGSLVTLITLWEVLAGRSQSLLAPRPTEVARALWHLLALPEFHHALWTSNQAMLLGYALAAGVGVPAGVLLGAAPRVGRVADVYLNVLLITPMPALAPLIVMATGLGLTTRVLVVWVFAVTIVVVATAAGVRNADPASIDMAQAFGANRRQVWGSVLLPGALPAIAGGLRLALGRAISGMIAAELLVVAVGVGRLLLRFQGDFDSAHAYAVALVVTAEGVVLTALVGWLERRWIPWREEAAGW
jgi:ABC-type nitrate/sulfonate/bicarbonate transport system permease component